MSASATWSAWSCDVRVTVQRDAQLSRASRIVADLMGEVDAAASRLRADSDVSRVNRGAGRLVPVSSLLVTLVRTALAAAADTDGLVDPTLATELQRVGYDADIATVRAGRAGSWSTGGRTARWSDVRVDGDLSLVGVPRGAGLDLGATAKAWTVDEAARRLDEALACAVLVEIGGDLSVAGTPGRPWRIDVGEVAGSPDQRVDLTSGALATSSTLARRWRTRDGRTAHHVLDPRTGRPVDGPWRTATVWAPDAVRANVASTAALVLGRDAQSWLDAQHLSARLVDGSGRVVRVGSWPLDEVIAS